MSEAKDMAPKPGGKPRRWLWPVLVASLALNLLVVGAVAGFAYRHKGGKHGGFGGRGMIGYVERALPPARRDELRPQIQELRQSMRSLRRSRRDAREEAARTLAVEPFEKEKYAGALSAQLQAEVNVRQAAHRLFVEAAARLTAEERRGFAEWSKRRRWRGRRGGRPHWRRD